MNNYIFQIDTKEKAYILGLLWGDGCLTTVRSKTRSCYLSFSMISKDFDEIKPCFKSFEDKRTWHLYIRNRPNNNRNYQPSITYNLYNKELAQYLISLGFDKKSYINIKNVFAVIPDELRNYWWRGYLDADGCITFLPTNGSHCLTFASTYEQDWNEHIKFIQNNFNINPRIYKTITKNNHKSSYLKIRKYNELVTFLDYIYDDYKNDRIGLYRKYEKYLKIKSHPKTYK